MVLRFLATGNSYSSLQWLFRISKQAISCIVPIVCQANIDVMKGNTEVSNYEQQIIDIADTCHTGRAVVAYGLVVSGMKQGTVQSDEDG
ncbi:hypothetical protein PR048_012852 [Dryococelus australis]|uniref:Uncharacterized protein n=1 Tax=Dryococelus australis TaxID=614101 RepID=A0ABQ9HQT7_9NEOP|nr:hypothetical protein PR048_012852 [Dryococelus australis]